jgi:RNA polymerase sigma-70 factor (ECF subfamily)
VPDTDASDSTEAFSAFFLAEYGRLARAMFLLTRDLADAEDLAQEAMIRVLERWDRVSSMTSPQGYLYTVALNVARRRGRLVRRLVAQPFRGEQFPLSEMDRADLVLDLLASLRQLSREQREALVLTAWVGMSAVEAGSVLGIDPTSVRGRVHRAKTKLRHALKEAEWTP